MNATKQTLTTRELADRWGVTVKKVLAFIDAGELAALNLAVNAHGAKPRYRFTIADVEAFENRRRTQPKPAPTPRRRRAKDPDVIEFF